MVVDVCGGEMLPPSLASIEMLGLACVLFLCAVWLVFSDDVDGC